jgi:putative ABC transport system permease protein
MNFFSLALKNLLRRKIRTILTILSVAIAISILFSLVAFNRGYEKEMKKELQYLGYHILIVPKGCPYEAASLVLHGGKFPRYLKDEYVDEIKKVPGVKESARLFMNSETDSLLKETKIYFGIDQDYLRFKPRWKFKEGSFFKDDHSAVIGQYVSETKKLRLGDKFKAFGEEFTVSGILEQSGDQDDGFYFLPIKTLTRVSGKEGLLVAVPIRVEDLSKIEEVADRLRAAETDMNVVSMKEVTGAIMGLVSSTRVLIYAVVLIAILISAVGVLNTILMSVFERTREIGMMKAVGSSRMDIFRLIWYETFIVCVTGGFLGSFLAVAGSSGIEKFIKKLMPYAPGGQLISADIVVIIVSVLFAVIMGILAGIYPAYRASNLRPIEAIRTE